MKNIAILLAGGSGKRLGSDIPKQFLSVAGKTILEHSLSAFQNNKHINEIFIVTNPDFIEQTTAIIRAGQYPKVTRVLKGGAERYHSTLAALSAIGKDPCNLIIHDAVRPLVSDAVITACINALSDSQACTTAIHSTDTILQSDPSGEFIDSIPDRRSLYNVQTPQGFHSATLREAYEKALKDPEFHSTDDCGVVKKYLPEVSVRIIEGSSINIKLTYAEDLPLIERLLARIQYQK